MAYLQAGDPCSQVCLFCAQLEASDADVHIVYRGRNCFVVLNRYPYNNGHVMVVPNAHVSSLEDLDSEAAQELMMLAQLSLRVLRQAYDPNGFNVGMNIGEAAGAGVAGHIHLHIVPRWQGDTNYLTVIGQTRTIPEWMDETCARLRPLFDKLNV